MPLSGRAALSNCRGPHPWQENKPAAHHSPLPINRSPHTHETICWEPGGAIPPGHPTGTGKPNRAVAKRLSGHEPSQRAPAARASCLCTATAVQLRPTRV